MSRTMTPKSMPHDRALLERGNACHREWAVMSKSMLAYGKNMPSFDIEDGGGPDGGVTFVRGEVNLY